MNASHNQDITKRAMDLTMQCSNISQQYFEGDEKEALTNRLLKVMKSLCEVDNNLRIYESCVQNVETVKTSQEDFEYSKAFEEMLAKEMKCKMNPEKHQYYSKFKASLSVAGDEEMTMQEEAPNIKCPISKRTMQSPVKNRVCGHIYDRASVLELMRLHKRDIRCPVSGCRSQDRFKASDLEAHTQLKEFIQAQADADSDQRSSSGQLADCITFSL